MRIALGGLVVLWLGCGGDGKDTPDAGGDPPDGGGGSVDAPSATNRAPVATDATFAATEDTMLADMVVASDPDGDTLAYSIVAMPAKGTLTLTTAGAVTYLPDAHANGSDTFTFKVSDGSLDSNVATASITIAPVNDAPVAVAATINTNEDTPASGTVVATDPDMMTPTFAVVSSPTKGAVTLNPTTGAFTYTPTANANGADSFAYRASDGTANSNTATVMIAIAPVNDPPTAGSFTLDALEGPAQVTLGFDVDGDPLTVTVVTGPTSGTFTGTGNMYTYTPTSPVLGAADTITYTVSDGTAASSNATISVLVAAVVTEFGTDQFDWGYAIAEDSAGNLFVAGKTSGAFPTFTNAGNQDAFIRKYDSAGNILWTTQFGTTAYDEVNSIAVSSAGVFVGGGLNGDPLLRKYDTNGGIVWTIPADNGPTNPDSIQDVELDAAGNIYVAGIARGAVPASGGLQVGVLSTFVRKYDSAGTLVWQNLVFSSYGEGPGSIALDAAGNIYVGGIVTQYWNGAAGFSPDYRAFLRKYSNATGARIWERQIPFTQDASAPSAITDASGNIYLAGDTPNLLAGTAMIGGRDAYLRKYDTSGSVLWTRQFGTTAQDDANVVTIHTNGNIYVAGQTYGAFPNKTNAGQSDLYIMKFDSTGTALWTRQFGTNSFDDAFAIERGGAGNLYVCGYAYGPFPGETNAGAYDAYFMKLQP